MPNVFLSHAAEDARLARALKAQLETAVPGAELFVSSETIQLGGAWLLDVR